MRLIYILTFLNFAVSSVLGICHGIPSRRRSLRTVVYWGQNGGTTVENNNLATYCTPESGIDIIVLAFLYEYGNGITIPSGTIGQSCYISSDGQPYQCDQLASAIEACRLNGVKVILSLGGASGAYSLSSREEAESIGQNLWEAYGRTNVRRVPRPFGDTFVDGWDFNIEANEGNLYYPYLIDQLRSNFKSDPTNTYYITGAPQCPIPEPNMQGMITNSKFDYLWVQFYNNPSCSITGGVNYVDWVRNVANTSSANAKIFLGVPASPFAATGTSSGAQYYVTPSDLSTLVRRYSRYNAFGGVMMWSAGFSDANVENGRTYAQMVKEVLTDLAPG